jgi:polyvinyl alcohol dehydrogenase (cytochrome)
MAHQTKLRRHDRNGGDGLRCRPTRRVRMLRPLALTALLGCDLTDAPRGSDAAAAATDAQAWAAPVETAADVPAALDAATHGISDAGVPERDGESESDADARAAAGGGEVASGRWGSYGYDQHNTQVNPHERTLTKASVAQLREQWRIRIPNGATSTPVVYDGSVYFGGWDGSAYAADATTGELRWQRKLTNNQVRSTPLVTADRVYVAAGRNLVALERGAGAIVFQTELATHPETMLDGSPKLVDGLVIIGVASVDNTFDKPDYTSVGAVVAIDAATGALVWRVPTTGDGPGPCVGGAGASVWSTAAIDEELGLAFIGTGQGHEEPASNCSDSLLAIHYRRDHPGERLAWHQQYTQGDVFAANLMSILGPDADLGAAPNLFEAAGRPLVGAGDKGGSYRAFDRRTGEPVWRTDLEIGALTETGGVMTTAAVHQGKIFVSSNKIDLSGVATVVILDPANSGGTATLYALDAANGAVIWKVVVPSPVAGALVVAGDVLYQTIGAGDVFARDPATGKELWNTKLELPIGVGPSVVDGRLYVSAGYGLGKSSSEPNAAGGLVVGFGLGAGPPKVWEVEVEMPEPLSQDACRAAVEQVSEWPSAQRPSATCSACLCECNATAAGHCDNCWLQAPCTVSLCSLFAPDELRACVSWACTTKLLPSNVFERGVELGPCMIRCADACGF